MSTGSDIIQTAMRLAFEEARCAGENNEVPIGAVVVRDSQIVSRSRNRILERKDPTAHAEISAIREASLRLGNERLTDCDLYTTLEPCCMCTGAIVLARIRKVYFLSQDQKLPGLRAVLEMPNHNHYPQWERLEIPGLDGEALLRDFFRQRRDKTEKGNGKTTDTN